MHHFEWLVIDDFTGGLFTIGDWMIPKNGAQQMLDCYPIPSGGIRAFMNWSTRSTAGLEGGTKITTGFFLRSGLPKRDGSPAEATDLYATTFDGTPRLHRLDLTVNPEPTSWTVIRNFAAASSGVTNMTFFTAYYPVNGTTNVYLTLEYLGADTGLWKVIYSSGAVSKVTVLNEAGAASAFTGALVAYQSRLVIGGGAGYLTWSEPGTETWVANNFLKVEPSMPRPDITWLAPFAPSDLMVAKEGSPFYLVQGDIEDPVVRQMADVHHSRLRQLPASLPDSIAYHAWGEGIFTTRQGVNPELLSKAIAAGDFTYTLRDNSAGTMQYVGPWLFTPAGLVWDSRTDAWFRTSAFSPTVPGKWMSEDQGSLYVLTQPAAGVAPSLLYGSPNEAQMARKSTYTWTSAPLRRDDGREIVIAEVQVVLKSYANGASCRVLCNGVERLVTNIGAGRQIVPARFREHGGVLDVTVIPDSNQTTVEAPSIEAVRVGHLPGHLLRAGGAL